MVSQNQYFYNITSGENMYFIEIVSNSTYYANQIILTAVPVALPDGYSEPSNFFNNNLSTNAQNYPIYSTTC
jgi:tellurite resistance protein